MNLEEKLIGNGLIFRESRLKRKSVSEIDRKLILRVRNEAYGSGYDRNAVNALEMRGERGEWGLRPQPVEAIYRGAQTILGPFTMRLYDIRGDTPLNGSTVSLVNVVNQGIWPYELNGPRLLFEYLKETILIGYINVSLWIGGLR